MGSSENIQRISAMRTDAKLSRARKIISNCFWGLCIFLTAISACLLVNDFYLEWKEELFWEKISNQKKEECAESTGKAILPEYETLYNKNSDMVGWIKINGTKIDYPVMQTKGVPEYYLRRNFEKKDDNSGTPFVDYRCNVLENRSFNIIIYGHYTQGDSMFRWLLNYSSESWYKENKKIMFDTINEKGIYEVVAAFYFDATGVILRDKSAYDCKDSYVFYNYIELDSKEGFKKFLAEIEKLKLYDTDECIKKGDKIITLICCAPFEFSNIKENGRFVVIAKKVL